MTEYWVSQAKHWCEYCRIYIAGNKSSIAFHENGKKHKEIVELSLRDMRKRGRERRHEESDLQKELNKIEKNAMKDYMHHDVAKEPQATKRAEVPADRAARLMELEAAMTSDRMSRAFQVVAGGTALPPGWRAMTNPDGKVFYMHDESGAIQWDKPGGGGGSGGGGGDGSGGGGSSSGGSGLALATDTAALPSAASAAAAGGWQLGWNDQGVPYYYHVARGITQWEAPEEWSAAVAEAAEAGGDAAAPPQSQHDLMMAQLEKQEKQQAQDEEAEQQRYRQQLAEAAAAEAAGGVDEATGLGGWTAVEEEEKPAEGWGYEGAQPHEKRQRVAWAVGKEEREEEEEHDALEDLKTRMPVNEEMQRAVEQQQAAAAAAAEAALASAPAAVFAKRKGGNKGIRKKD